MKIEIIPSIDMKRIDSGGFDVLNHDNIIRDDFDSDSSYIDKIFSKDQEDIEDEINLKRR